jgi:hypothetical protein
MNHQHSRRTVKRKTNDGRYPLTCRRLENVGIDPDLVPVGGLSLAGYTTAPLTWTNRERAAARRSGMLPRTFHRWTIPQETRNGILAANRSEQRATALTASARRELVP